MDCISPRFILINSGHYIKPQGTSQTPFCQICSKVFQKTQKILDQSNNIIQFKFKDEQLDTKSNETLSSLGINNSSDILISWKPKTSSDKKKNGNRK